MSKDLFNKIVSFWGKKTETKQTYLEQLSKKAGKLKGNPKIIFNEILANEEKRGYYENMHLSIFENKKSMSDILDSGLKEFFCELMPNKISEDFCQLILRLPNYTYNPSSYRRSYRSGNPSDYEQKIYFLLKEVFFDWEKFDLLTYLKMSDSEIKEKEYKYPRTSTISQLIAFEIDNENKDIINIVNEIILSENNFRIVNHELIRGVAMSKNTELHSLMKKLLLAAKLQEGLRQAILETADDGCKEYLVEIIECILENNLLRFSSAIRAVDTWMGLGYDYSDKKIIEKLLRLGYNYTKDETARKNALYSKDVTEIYAAMWSESVHSIDNLYVYINKFMSGEKYQKMVALYFLHEADSKTTSIEICGDYIKEDDLDILTLIINNYKIDLRSIYYADKIEDTLKQYPHLNKKETRDKHFEIFLEDFEKVPKKGYSLNRKPFNWCNFFLTKGMIFERLMVIAAYDFDEDKVVKLIEIVELVESDSRIKFLKYFATKINSEKSKEYIFSCLSDKSITLRVNAIKKIKELELNEEDILKLESLLSLKTGQLRQSTIEILNDRSQDLILKSIERLISNKDENKRLASLDMLSALKEKGKIKQEQLEIIISSMPIATERELIMVKNLKETNQSNYSEENGFGLYDVDYYPDLETIEKHEKFNLKSFKKIPLKNLTTVMDSLLDLIEKHKDYAFTSVNHYGNRDEILGNINWLQTIVEEESRKHNFNDYVLYDVWLDWEKQNNIDLYTLVKLNYFIKLMGYNEEYTLDYENFTNKLIKETLDYDGACKFAKWCSNKKFMKLAKDIVLKLLQNKYTNDTFYMYYGVLSDLLLTIPKNNWEKDIYPKEDNGYGYRNRKNTLIYTSEISFFINNLRCNDDNDMFKKRISLLYELGKITGSRFNVLNITDILLAESLSLVSPSEICRVLIKKEGQQNMSRYTGVIYKSNKELLEKFPIFADCVNKVVNRVIEIELKRGDTVTPVSRMASSIREHKGAETFSELLVAMGNETLTRGYGYSSTYSKKEVLSSLLKASVPKETDTKETLKDCLKGRVSDKRLLEAAMYAPAWINIVQQYIGWEGLKCGAWYFHAHTRNSYSAEFETEVARFSPIDKEEFQRGAFDINWFKEAYNSLGEERFKVLYDCAKYISEGASHRRAQLFADAVLGKLSVDVLEKDILDKRNKDLLLSYSLVPFSEDEMKESLRRFEFINDYLKKSKEFGAQRQASEKQASEIALGNLARNLGFSDVLRFNWKMEILKMDLIQDYFKPHIILDTTIYLEMDQTGIANLVVKKNDKVLKSIPKSIKNDEYVKSISNIKTSLKQQFSRAKISLEKAMENQDEFTFSEVCDLLNHPVIAPIIEKLIFKTAKNSGFLKEFGLQDATGKKIKLKKSDILTIAHCYDLYKSDKWQDYQRFAFENALIQPFKQIFRELYILNDDEKSEKTISRRYAGHQVQPMKTVALLKSRGWTVDYESGLQKVYYKENIIATIYALADWFSPADIEAPTLETVNFYNRKTHEPLDMNKINPLLFSEVMRDVDLVVSVAHVGGVDPMASHSTVEMRGFIVKEAMRIMKIENVKVEAKHAIIQGVHGQYSVHLGSGIAHQMGQGALHIIPVHSQHRGHIFLPFMDEDPKTAEIVSKVLLLAEDSKIKDPSVMMQIES